MATIDAPAPATNLIAPVKMPFHSTKSESVVTHTRTLNMKVRVVIRVANDEI